LVTGQRVSATVRPSAGSVAEFVAQGMTNRETAAQMSLSPHTVNIHLRRIFRKLEIESRVDLARLVAERRAATAAP
jgi:DNA-binding CsgD family transcriptional regulator